MKRAIRFMFRFLGACFIWPCALLTFPVIFLFFGIMWMRAWAYEEPQTLWYLRRGRDNLLALLAFWRDE